MKINSFQLINIYNTLNAYIDKKLPQKISYAITKNLIRISDDIKCYNQELGKIFKNYDEYIEKNDEGEYVTGDGGLPVVKGDMASKYYEDITDLLNIETEVNLYYIPDAAFDYDDNDRFDPLSATDILSLQNIMCKNEEKETEAEQG